MSRSVWAVLGITRTTDKAAIRRAYAEKLKALDVDADVAGYAALRQARDSALRMASQAAAKDHAAGEPLPPEAGGEGPVLADDPADDLADDLAAAMGGDPGGVPGEEGGINRADVAEPDVPPPAPEDTPEARVSAMLRDLAGLLFPGGEYSDDGFTLPDYEAALRLVDALVDEAQQGRLEVHSAIDHHLAGMFAEAWPRSSALVERANEEFGWLGEAGSIDERYALRFLNARIKGMRFVERVQQPDHVLHKAWMHLARPGNPGALDSLKASKDDVRTLLGGIRERFPEVESYLNPERVSWWDRKLADNGPGLVGQIVRSVGLAYLGIMALGLIVDIFSGDTEPARRQVRNEAYQSALEQLLDPADGQVRVGTQAPQLDVLLRDAFDSTTDEAEGLERMRSTARYWIIVEGETRQSLDFDGLLALLRVKQDWLVALRDKDRLEGGCPLTNPEDRWGLGNLDLPEEAERRETALLRMLLAQQMLERYAREQDGPAQPREVDVPGEIVVRATERSGLSRAAFDAALGNPRDTNRCVVNLAMIETVLERPGEAPAELLRIL